MSTLIEAPAYRSPEWYSWRQHGLGGSDLPVILGKSRWRGELQLALEKRGETERDDTDNPQQRWGKVIESLVLDFLEDEVGPITRGETFVDDRWPHLWVTLDGRVERIGYEVKATRSQRITDEIRVQALAQIGLADLELCNVVFASPFGEPVLVPVERDDEAIRALFDWAEEWWQRYIENRDDLPLDGSAFASQHLSRTLQRGEDVADADEYQTSLARKALEMRRLREQADTDERKARQLLQQSMVGKRRLDGDGFHVSWIHRDGSTQTNWQGVAAAYRMLLEAHDPHIDFDTVVGIHTTRGEPSDYVTVKEES